jgi:hypothetical protein
LTFQVSQLNDRLNRIENTVAKLSIAVEKVCAQHAEHEEKTKSVIEFWETASAVRRALLWLGAIFGGAVLFHQNIDTIKGWLK